MTNPTPRALSVLRAVALAGALLLPVAVAGCSRSPAGSEDAGVPEPPAPTAEETAPAESEAAEADEAAEAAELARREGELAAAEEGLTRREELARREEEIAAREAEIARRERQAAGTPAGPAPAPPQPAPPVVESPAPATPEPQPAPTRELVEVTVPAGTLLDVEFLDGVSSETSQVGETFLTRVAADVTADGLVAIPAGARVIGVVTEAVPLKRIGGRARLGLELDRLVLPDGSELPIAAALAEAGRSETGKDAATIGGAAAAGAILGRATAGRSDRKKNTIIGTILGGAAGAVIASRTEGEEITIPEGTFITLALDQPVRLTVER